MDLSEGTYNYLGYGKPIKIVNFKNKKAVRRPISSPKK